MYTFLPTHSISYTYVPSEDITKTRLFKFVYWNFSTKKWKFSDKNSDIFNISAQNIDCGYSLEPPRRGGSNEYQQPMFLSRNKKNNVYPCKPQFYYIKVGFLRGSKLYRYVLVMSNQPAQSHRLICLKTLFFPWLPTEGPAKILIRLRGCEGWS